MSQSFLLSFLFVAFGAVLSAQVDSLKTVDLAPVEIKSLRLATSPLLQPLSIATYSQSPIQATRQQLSLQEYLTEVPGLFSLNANNYAQDLRLSIRGFGARSAFGIRGIKIVVDGIPETTPDGQGQIDNLNIGSIQRIEVLKGPAAALYGNASGGVIQIFSQDNFKQNFLEAGVTLGSFNMQQYQLKGGWVKNNSKLIFQGARTQSDGYRDQSKLENTNLNLRYLQTLSDKAKFEVQVNYTDSPVGDDPGGLQLTEVEINREQARDRNITFKAGEAIDQFKVGSRYQYQINGEQDVELYGFYNRRNFIGRLPFSFGGWVDLTRNYWGQGGAYKFKKATSAGSNVLQLGYAFAGQSDHRTRYVNEEGTRGMLTLDQFENFFTVGLYALDHLYINKWLFTGGLRFDQNKLKATDQKLEDGDQSGLSNLSAINPSLGINYQLDDYLHLYGNFRTGFETPSLSELSANPTGDGGFNIDLQSQRSTNYEIGFKGLLGKKIDFDLTFFYINTIDDLVPYEIEAFAGRTFFRNAGKTNRQGVEFWARYQFSPNFSFRSSYTFSQFKYEDFQTPQYNLSGQTLPGIPKHNASFSLTYQNDQGFNIRLQHRMISKFFANDQNSISEPAYQLTDLSLGYRLDTKSATWTPFFGINNIFNTRYSDNIRLNAFGSRHYEPAPGINIFGGIRCRLAK